jgi:hypothetical protein
MRKYNRCESKKRPEATLKDVDKKQLRVLIFAAIHGII